MRAALTLALNTALAPHALRWAPAVPAGLLALFVLTWGDGTGVTAWPDWTFYEQTRGLAVGLMVAVLPWTALRALPAMSGTDWMQLSALTGAPPSRLLLARAAAVVIAAAVVVVAPVPILILAQRMSGGPVTQVAIDTAALLGMAAVATVTAAWLEHWAISPASAWGAGAAVLAVSAGSARYALGSPAAIALTSAVVATVGLLLLLRVLDRHATLHPEGTA